MKVCLTVDLEHDCPPYLSGYRGIEEGVPRLLELLRAEQIQATWFCTGDVARRYPERIRELVAADHELGCHGDSHRPFDMMTSDEAEREIEQASQTLRQFHPVTSFRAPNLRFPDSYLNLLEENGYRLDSSQAIYKAAYRRPRAPCKLLRIPASVTSSVLRLPRWIRYSYFKRLKQPIVLFVHPWEFVDLRREKLRLDCRFRTGQVALTCLQENIRFFKGRSAQFVRMQDLQPADSVAKPDSPESRS